MHKTKNIKNLWAIEQTALDSIENMMVEAGKDPERFKAMIVEEDNISGVSQTFFRFDNVAVMVVAGVVQPKTDFWSYFFGGASLDVLTRDFKALVNDDTVKTIILDIDSPGGNVFGVQEFANLIFEARDKKNIYATTSSSMTSAAYWIGSAAHEVYVTDEAAVTGSIGVIATHIDFSELQKRMGIKTTYVTAGTKKAIASHIEPLTEQGRQELQGQVDHIYRAFTGDVAKFRGVPVERVLSGMADGQLFLGSQGVEAGLIDGVLSSEEFMKGITGEESFYNNIMEGEGMTIINKIKKSAEALTVESLRKDYPEVYDEIFAHGAESTKGDVDKRSFDDGFEKGAEAGRITGAVEGAKAEAERIKEVSEQALPGHEALVEKLKFDGKTTGAEAAKIVLAAEKNRHAKGIKTLADEAIKPIEEETSDNVADAQTLEQKWAASKDLQSEFSSFESFKAYTEGVAAGRVRIFNPGRKQ